MLSTTRFRLAVSSALLPFLVVSVSAQEGEAKEVKPLTLEQASGRDKGPRFSPTLGSFSWAEDGVHIVKGRGKEAMWIDPVTMEESKPPTSEAPAEDEAPAPGERGERGRRGERDESASESSSERDAIAGALEALEGVDADAAKKIARRRGAASEDGNVRLFRTDDDGLYFYGKDAEGAERVGKVDAADGPFELLDLSDDGDVAAWVKENDLYLLDTTGGDLIRVTENGSDEFFNGKLDWVYQEEVYGRGNFKAFWIAPSAKHLAFIASDESAVHEFTVIDHIEKDTFRVKPEIVNYPKVGDPNPTVQLGLADTSNGRVTWADLGEYEDIEFLIVRVGWTPTGECLFMIQDRIQTWCELLVADPATGETKRLLREESDTWVNRPSPPRWLADGTFLWESERTGYQHVYHYQADGTLIGPVTEGEWQVRRITEVDEEAGLLFFEGTEGGAVNSNAYRIALDGTGMQRLTRGPGRHSISLRPDREYLIDRVSSLSSPGEVRLCDGDGDVIAVLDTATIPAEEEGHPVARFELTEIEARDGMKLDVAVQKPVPFDENEAYPVWLSTYSGPDAPSVRNAWSSSTWNQFLAQNGIIVLQVNVRSASGKGQWAIGQCYKQLGASELRDIVDTVDWLTAHPWADAKRVGITGYSYGGFMSAYALLGSDRFALGIAGGGVYDWAMYDTIYTERYMSTPELNPEGYATTSCLNKAKDLTGFLHMHHGVMDDNVHFQNMLQLAFELQKAGKTNWSMMPYPQNRHGISNAGQRWHSRQLEWQLIQEHLRPTTSLDRQKQTIEARFDEEVLPKGDG